MFNTSFQKSNSNKAAPGAKKPRRLTLDSPVQFLKGVGPGLGAVFARRDLHTVRDLLYFFPRHYEDRSRIKRVADLHEDELASVALTVVSASRIPMRGRQMFAVRATDGVQNLNLKWFHVPRGMDARFKPGVQFIATGKPKTFRGQMEIVHPEIHMNSSATVATEGGSVHVGRIVPIYVEIEGISSRILRRVLHQAVTEVAPQLTDDPPGHLLQSHHLIPLREAVATLHFPPENANIDALVDGTSAAHQRLIYDEFFKFEYLVLRQRLNLSRESATALNRAAADAALPGLKAKFPFPLTGDQARAVAEILEDMTKPHPMSRLLQGDVGSGKTAVSLIAAGLALDQGAQAVLMAPTEILAEQHFRNAQKVLPTVFVSGKTPAPARAEVARRLESGEPLLVIGTHALLEPWLKFKTLALVMIDEQHRFGVDQRRTLTEKARPFTPHTLALSATPIPRTLALTAYGDLAISSLRELPPGRSPILTEVLRGASERKAAFETIRSEIQAGRQAYIIFPLIETSESEGFEHLRAATVEFERLQKEVFPTFRLGLLHGGMAPAEKQAVMDAFKSGAVQVLVSTTVVEVGVDVPNATVMVIDHAERFGLSQLHQLRGRVGRGALQSRCYLLAPSRSGEVTETRLDVLEETTDGFKIAEADLKLRGPGEFLGTRQAGALPFKIADLLRDSDWLAKARHDAIVILKADPDLIAPEHAALNRYFQTSGAKQAGRMGA